MEWEWDTLRGGGQTTDVLGNREGHLTGEGIQTKVLYHLRNLLEGGKVLFLGEGYS